MHGAPGEPLTKDELAESAQAALPKRMLRKDSRRQWMLRVTRSPRLDLGTIEGHLQGKGKEGNLNEVLIHSYLINSNIHVNDFFDKYKC